MAIPGVGAPHDERERRQLRATYYGAQREVDDGLAPLFEYLDRSGLAESTLVVLTSDHGEMGGDHWLLEKLGFWDESYHVPLIVVDPRAEADGGAGHGGRGGDRVGRRAADHLRLHGRRGAAAGRRLVARARSCAASPRPSTGATRRTSNGASRTRSHLLAETTFGIPMSHCALGGVRAGRGTSTSSSRRTPPCSRRCCSTSPTTRSRRTTCWSSGARR